MESAILDNPTRVLLPLHAASSPRNCPHNCGENRGMAIYRDGKLEGYHWTCACAGCGIILRTGM